MEGKVKNKLKCLQKEDNLIHTKCNTELSKILSYLDLPLPHFSKVRQSSQILTKDAKKNKITTKLHLSVIKSDFQL